MTIEEFKEDLNDYMGEGTFTVKEVDNNRIHIIWNINGNDYSIVIESKLLNMKPRDICEEVVRPTVMKFKMVKRRKEQLKEQLERAAIEHKAVLDYLKDK